MKNFYIGVKQVEAWEETRDGQEGYGVKYADGYLSWSPKDVFEKAYLPQGVDVLAITPRMIQEFIVGMETVFLDGKAVCLFTLKNGFQIFEGANNVSHGALIDAHEQVKRKVKEFLEFTLASARNGFVREGDMSKDEIDVDSLRRSLNQAQLRNADLTAEMYALRAELKKAQTKSNPD